MNRSSLTASAAAALVFAGALPTLAAPSSADRAAFRLGYCLEHAALIGHRFAGEVKRLAGESDADEAADEAALAAKATAARKQERNTWEQARMAGSDLGIGPSTLDWMSDKMKTFATPPKSPADATPDDSPDARTVMATLDDVSASTSESTDRIPTLVASLKMAGGPSSIWAFEAGQLMADAGMPSSDQDSPDADRMRAWAAHPPRGSDGSLRNAVAPLAAAYTPSPTTPGTGNLGNLLPNAPARTAAARKTRNALLEYYQCEDLPRALLTR